LALAKKYPQNIGKIYIRDVESGQVRLEKKNLK